MSVVLILKIFLLSSSSALAFLNPVALLLHRGRHSSSGSGAAIGGASRVGLHLRLLLLRHLLHHVQLDHVLWQKVIRFDITFIRPRLPLPKNRVEEGQLSFSICEVWLVEPPLQLLVVAPLSDVELGRDVGLQHVRRHLVEDVKQRLEGELSKVARLQLRRLRVVARRQVELVVPGMRKGKSP